MSERPVHIAAAILPLIEGAEFDRLVESIRDKGLDNPVVLTPAGEVLDGRNRLRACEAAGVAPRFVTHDGDPYDYVRRANLLRRQLTPSQLAAYEVELSEGAARAAAKERQEEAGRRYGENHPKQEVVARGPQPLGPGQRARDEMAERVGVSARTVERVLRVKAQDPEVFEKIKTGEVTAREAERNVARKAILSGPERRTKADLEERRALAASMAATGSTSDQIAARLGIGTTALKDLCKRHNIAVPADAVVGKRRRADSNRIIEETAGALAGLRMGLELVDYSDLDQERIGGWVESIGLSLRSLNQMNVQLKKLKESNLGAA